MADRTYETVKVEKENGVTWVILNRPEKKNAMNPQLNRDMCDVLADLEHDPETQVLVLTGAGDAWSAGMDIKEYFAANDRDPAAMSRARWDMQVWQYHKLRHFPRVTIAAVNGWCFGGAFTPLVSCDVAIAAEEAVFGLSEVNWGILPAGYVSRDLALVMGYRDALYYTLTGETFTAQQALDMKLVNKVVPRAQLREAVLAQAEVFKRLNPHVLRSAKEAFKHCIDMNFEDAFDYLLAKLHELRFRDPEQGRSEGIRQFVEEKTYKPGLAPYPRRD